MLNFRLQPSFLLVMTTRKLEIPTSLSKQAISFWVLAAEGCPVLVLLCETMFFALEVGAWPLAQSTWCQVPRTRLSRSLLGELAVRVLILWLQCDMAHVFKILLLGNNYFQSWLAFWSSVQGSVVFVTFHYGVPWPGPESAKTDGAAPPSNSHVQMVEKSQIQVWLYEWICG